MAFAFLIVAIILISQRFPLRVSLFSIFVAAFTGSIFFVPKLYQFNKSSELMWAGISILLFFCMAVPIAFICNNLRGARDEAHDAAELAIQQQRELARVEIRYRELFENARDAVAIGLDLRHVYVNPAYITMLGYDKPCDLEGMAIIETIAPGVREVFKDRATRRLAGSQEPESYETIGLRKDGTTFPVEIKVTLYKLEDKLYTIAFCRDVSDQRRAQTDLSHHEQQLKALHSINLELSQAATFDELCRMTVKVGHERLGFGRMSVWLNAGNGKARGTFGIDENSEVRDERKSLIEPEVGTPMELIMSGKEGLIAREDIVLLDHQQNPVGTGWHCVAALYDGRDIIGCLAADSLNSTEPLTDRTKELFSLFASNVGNLGTIVKTERDLRASQSELRAFNSELENRVKIRTAELESANEEMESFTYTVSHDLRSPLRAIMSTSMIILQDHGERLDDDAKILLKRQAAAAKRLGTLIDDLLNLTRLGRAQLAVQQFNFSALAAVVVNELAEQDEAIGAMVCIQPDIQVVGDPALIRIALQNLIENSVKFSSENKEPCIEVGRQDDGTIFVKDNGIGFDMAYASKLFVPFERLVSEQEFPGTGIGLASVSRILHRHGGEIWAEGEVGKGATFYFTLPG